MTSQAKETVELSPFARDVVDLYESALEGVQFPDLDLASLRALVATVGEAQAKVRALEEQLAAANQHVQDCNLALLARAERALSYARIYADGNDELSTRIDAIRKPGKPIASDSAAPKKRGRPAKVSPVQSELLERAAE